MDKRIVRPAELYEWIDTELSESDAVSPQDVASEALSKLSPAARDHLTALMVEVLFLDRAFERSDEAMDNVERLLPQMRPGETLGETARRLDS